MKFIKLLINDFDNASRDKRELTVINELDQEIVVVARGNNHIEKVGKYTIHSRTSRPLGDIKILASLNRLISIFSWAHYVRVQKADCISCHDIIALIIGWMSTWGMKNKPKLVYDAHEFEIGRNTGGNRGKLKRLAILRFEKFLMNKCAFSIMVNDSIADAVHKMYKLEKKPLVVRNIPQYWQRDDEECQRIRKELCDALKIPVDTFLIMYHGAVTGGRGIETLIEAVKVNYNISMIVLGDGDENYMKFLKTKTENIGIKNRVLFHPAVPINILKDYAGAVDCGMVTIPNVCESYYYMLPNKFFENIQSETPIIGSEFPEIKKIVEKYGVGLCCNPEEVESINRCIELLRNDRKLYQDIKNNLKEAKKELCWENEKIALEEAYKKILI